LHSLPLRFSTNASLATPDGLGHLANPSLHTAAQEDLSPWIWIFQEFGLPNRSQGPAESCEANLSKNTKDGVFGSVIKRLRTDNDASLPSAVGVDSCEKCTWHGAGLYEHLLTPICDTAGFVATGVLHSKLV
jgi:hypothetical protein